MAPRLALRNQRGKKRTLDVGAPTIDSLRESGALPTPTVLKFDTERAEILALRGAARLLNGPSAPRMLFLEVHDSLLPCFGSSASEVLAIGT